MIFIKSYRKTVVYLIIDKLIFEPYLNDLVFIHVLVEIMYDDLSKKVTPTWYCSSRDNPGTQEN